MGIASRVQKFFRPAGLVMSLGLLLIALSACGNLIQIVPVNPPTPVAVSQVVTNNIPPETIAAGPPRRIVAPTINLDAPVTEMGWRVVDQWGQPVSEWEMPDEEAGWHRNSARPGEESNVVISGHNGSTGGQVFARLDELQVGDEITLWTDKPEPVVYQVIEKTIVRTFAISEEADRYLRSISEPTAREQLTLITCWPNWTNTHRLIVIAVPK